MSLVNTLMQPLRTEYMGSLDKNESRPSRYGAYDFMVEDGNSPASIFDSDIKDKIKMSFGNTVVIPVLDAKDVTITNVRSCTIADDDNTSQLVTLTFVTYAFGFTMYPSQYFNNDIKYQADFTRKLRNYLIKFAAELDTGAIAAFEANKNEFWTGVAGNPYAQIGNALQVSQAEKNDYYNNLQAIKETMDFYGDIKVVSSTSGSPLVRRLDAQGAQNGINENFQITPYDWVFTNRIPNGAGIESTHYAITEGSTALETRVDPDAMARSRVADQYEWDTVSVPLPGARNPIEMGAFYRKDCADGSGLNGGTGTSGLTRTLKESYEWSVDVVYATAYNSDPAARFGPILKTEISAS